MTPEQRIDEALDSVLRASGSALKYHTSPLNIETMRKVMRKIMSDSYISGSNDCFKAMQKSMPNVKLSASQHPTRILGFDEIKN